MFQGCPEGRGSVISHNREGSELVQFSFILPLPLLIRVARLVKLLGQVSEDLMHFRVVDDLSGRQEVSRGWTPGTKPPQHCTLWAGSYSLNCCPSPQPISQLHSNQGGVSHCRSPLASSTAWGGNKSKAREATDPRGGGVGGSALLSEQHRAVCVFWVVEEDSTVQGWGWGEVEGPWQVLGDREWAL